MEAHIKNKIALAVAEEIWAEDFCGKAPKEDPPEEDAQRPRQHGDGIPYETVVKMTDMAREMGPTHAERQWKKIHLEDVSRQTFQKYLHHYQEKAKDATVAPLDRYFKPTERGRHFALDEHETKCVLEAISLFRKKKKSVNARVVSRIARGVVRRLRPGLVEQGVLLLGLNWAKSLLGKKNCSAVLFVRSL